MRLDQRDGKTPTGFMTRLRRDRRGNVMVMMAIALIPTCAFAGSAVDMARLYTVRVRLQQACDAGALAGRRAMVDDSDPTLDPEAVKQANTFFDNNLKSGWFSTKNIKRSFTGTPDFQVAGAAEAEVPMAIMGMFNQGNKVLKVACAARLDIPDVDVMMVLDTTGSMACPPSGPSSCGMGTYSYTRSDGTTGYAVSEATGSRIGGLRQAVLDFYDAMDTYTDDRTQVRYGFVPYTSTVNAGYQVPASFVENTSYSYQTRRPSLPEVALGSPVDSSFGNLTNAECRARAVRNPAATSTRPLTYRIDGRADAATVKSWTENGSSGKGTCVISTQTVGPMWHYRRESVDVSRYVTGAAVEDLSKFTGATSRWQGCLEETETAPAASYDQNALPKDLNPDLTPGKDRKKLAPMWSDQTYNRYAAYFGYPDKRPESEVRDGYPPPDWAIHYRDMANRYWLERGNVSCGKAVQRLKVMSRSEVGAFVNAPEFKPLGGTYHDTGMIWGARFLSPTGPFKGDTAAWPGKTEPNRHLIFMTDGEMAPNADIYGMYGIERFDQRVGGGDVSADGLKAKHNARFRAVCEAAKARNITVWVIAFGEDLNDDLEACATQPSSQYAIFAASTTDLRNAFRRIAKQVASLRVYK